MQKQKLTRKIFCGRKKKLAISVKVVGALSKYCPKENQPEAGGILLGHVYRDRDEIEEISIPSRFDKRGLFFFNRKKDTAQLKINKAWHVSKGTLIYFGEWHTHSERTPSPSSIDKDMIKRACEETKMGLDYLYLLIVGMNNTYWVGRQTQDKLEKLREIC
jgi:integrative and conjugative element protein (TIGR02256 family)